MSIKVDTKNVFRVPVVSESRHSEHFLYQLVFKSRHLPYFSVLFFFRSRHIVKNRSIFNGCFFLGLPLPDECRLLSQNTFGKCMGYFADRFTGGSMIYAILPLTEDPWQVFTLDLAINGEAFHAQIEIRYLPAPDQWVLSIWDHALGELLVNQIPLICSYEQLNDPCCRSGTCGTGRGWDRFSAFEIRTSRRRLIRQRGTLRSFRCCGAISGQGNSGFHIYLFRCFTFSAFLSRQIDSNFSYTHTFSGPRFLQRRQYRRILPS